MVLCSQETESSHWQLKGVRVAHSVSRPNEENNQIDIPLTVALFILIYYLYCNSKEYFAYDMLTLQLPGSEC